MKQLLCVAAPCCLSRQLYQIWTDRIWREIAVVLTFSNLMLLTLGGSLKLISHDMKILTTFMTFINDLSTLVRKAVLVWKTITLQIFESSNIDHKYMYEYIRSRSPLLLNDKKIDVWINLLIYISCCILILNYINNADAQIYIFPFHCNNANFGTVFPKIYKNFICLDID